MNQGLYVPQQSVYQDRRGWLIAFGVVEILIACLLALMAAFMVLLVPSMPKPPGQPPIPQAGMFYFVGAFYLALAAGFATVGAGSIRAREWARITMIVVSSLWLAFGVLGTVFSAVLMPAILRQQQQNMPPQPPLPENFQFVMMTITIGFQVAVMVLLPLIFLLFYCGKNVKATCQAGSRSAAMPNYLLPSTAGMPAARKWPVPIVILIVWFAFSTLSMLACAGLTDVAALFGVFIHGVPARIFYVVGAAVYGYCAWSFFKLQKEGWWLAVVSSALWMVSFTVSMILLGPARLIAESSQRMKLDPQQADVLALTSKIMPGVFGLSMVLSAAVIALIIYCKPFFFRRNATTA